jgi:hypothetical protein
MVRTFVAAPRRYPYFGVVAGLVWSHDPESYAGSATGRVSHVRQVKGDDPDEKGYPGPPDWGLGVRLTTPPHKKYCYETSKGGQGPPRAVEPMMMTFVADYSSSYWPTINKIHLRTRIMIQLA